MTNNPPAPKDIGTIANIQILRFIAAFWVALLHAKVPVIFGHLMPDLPRFLSAIQKAGFVGVDIFFVISGVIMALTTHSTPPSVRAGVRFLIIRYARIYCGWWPFFILYLLAYSILRDLDPEKNLLGSLFLIPMGLNHYLIPIIWTLSFELFFYTLVALILPIHLQNRVIIVGAISALLAGFIIWSATQGFYTPDRFGETWPLHQFIAFPLIGEFLAGFLLYEWIRAHRPRLAWPWLIGAAAFFASAVYFQKFLTPLHADGLEGYFYSHWRALLVGGFAICLVAAALIAKPWFGATGRMLARLGDASYAIYLSHVLIFGCASWLLMLVGWPPSARAWSYVAMLLAVIVYSYLHFRWIELPLYALVRRFINRAMPDK